MNTDHHKRSSWPVAIVGVIVASLLVFELAVYAGVITTPLVVGTNTVTTTVYTSTTSVVTSTAPYATETNTQFNQPVITLTTTGSTNVSTVYTTVTTTPTTTTTTTITAASTLFTPFAMYYTGYTSGGYGTPTVTAGHFFRSLTPIDTTYSDAMLSESYNGASLNMALTQSTNNSYDLGFYYAVGTLATLTAGNGLTITGTGFSANLWLNPGSWAWTPISAGEQYVGTGSNGAYGLGSTRGTQTINGATMFTSFTGASCSGNLTVAQLEGGDCGMGPSTPVAIWVGIGPITGAGSTTATVDSIYIS